MKKIMFAVMMFVMFSVNAFSATAVETKWTNNGKKLYNAKMYEKAIQSFDYVLKYNPRNATALVYLGYSYAALGKKAEAIEYLEKAYKYTRSKKIYAYVQTLKKEHSSVSGDYIYKGGIGRLYGMGNMEIAVPDNASIVDPYADGFVSYYAFRPVKNIANHSIGLGMNFSKTAYEGGSTIEGSSIPISLNMIKERDNSVAYWISNDGVLILKPLVAVSPGSSITTPAAGDSSEYSTFGLDFAFEAEFAQKVKDNISIGALLGYASLNDTYEDSEGINKDEIKSNKFEYLVSATYLLPLDKNTLGFSLSVGSKSDLLSELDFTSIPYFGIFAADVLNHYNVESINTYESDFVKDIDIMKLDVRAIDIGVGVSLQAPGKGEASAKLSISPGLSGTFGNSSESTNKSTDAVTEYSTEYEAAQNGMQVNFSLKGRYYFDAVIPGISIDYKSLAIEFLKWEDDTDPEDINIGILQVSAGASLKVIPKFLIPLEIYLLTGSYNQAGIFDAVISMQGIGVRGGVEYELDEKISLRGGVDYTSGGTTMKMGTANPDPVGTEDNPANNELGINLGVGFKDGFLELNTALRYQMNMLSPLPEYYEEYGVGQILLVTDIKIFL